jgi:hypothetical protein
MAKVSESIFSGKTHIIPMAEISHLRKGVDGKVNVIFKHSVLDEAFGDYQPYTILFKEEAEALSQAWCHYRYELEGGSEAFIGAED